MLSPIPTELQSSLRRVYEETGRHFEVLSQATVGPCTVTHLRLDNGLTVILQPDPRRPVFAWHTWIAVGSRHEQAHKTGMAHFFEHLMYRGTERFPEGEYDRFLERRGAQSNAATWLDWTQYHASLPSDPAHVDLIAALEGDRLANLRTDDDVLATEREVVLNERQYRVDDDPDGALGEHLWSVALPDHPYGSPTIGWQAHIEAITADDCNRFRQRWYTPDRVTLVIVGGVDPTHVLTAVAREYGGFTVASTDRAARPATPFVSARATLDLPVSTPRLLIAYPSPAATDASLLPLEIALDIVFGGESGRAVRSVVHQHSLALALDGWVAALDLPSLCEISLSGRDGVSLDALESGVREVLDDFLQHGPTPAELDRSRRQLEIELYRGQLTVDGVASRYGHDALVYGDHLRFQTLARRVESITTNDVLEAARAAFSTEPAVVGATPK